MKKYRLISAVIVVVLVFSCFPVSAENMVSKSDVAQSDSAFEITNPFSSVAEWKEHLISKNNSYAKDNDLAHETIQTILRERGVAGLNKHQYNLLLAQEGLGEFVADQIVVMFNGSKATFQNPKLNDLVKNVELVANLFYTITLKKEYSEREFLDLMEVVVADPNVAMAQPNFLYAYTGYEANLDYEVSTMAVALEQVNATTAWRYTTGEASYGITVGMVDTGITGNWCTVESGTITDCSATGSIGHGTSVATVIGGNTSILGVAPSITVCCVGGCEDCIKGISHGSSEYTYTNTTNFAGQIFDLINNYGCDVINISNGMRVDDLVPGETKDYMRQVMTSYETVLFVQSAGNDSANLTSYTGIYTYYNLPNFIYVAAVDRYDNLWTNSNYGPNVVHIAAPGVNLQLPGADGEIYYRSGTSFAAPFVSGAAALLMAEDITLTASQIKNIILNTADSVPELRGKVQGARRLNVGAAVLSLNPDYSDRYAYLDTNKVLRGKHGATSAWTQIGGNITQAQLNIKDNYYLKTGGLVSHCDADTFHNLGSIEYLENAKSFAAYGDMVVTLDTSNTMRIHRYVDYALEFNTFYTVENVKTFTLSGNFLAYCFTTSPHIMFYHPNIAKWTSYTPEMHLTGGASINGIYSIGSRIHLLCANNKYRVYEYMGNGTIKTLITEDNMTSYVLSLSENRWIHAVGSTLSVYGWNSEGERYPIGTITAPNGATITACKAIDNRICFLAGGNLYGVDGYYSGKDVPLLATNVQSATCVDKMIGIIQTNGAWKTKNGSLTDSWETQATGNVASYAMSP